ncbi:MAG: YqaA family protein [bacterium]
MKLFTRLYDRVLELSGHNHAVRYLAALSFAESSFFPIPPDVMLAPMVLKQPNKAFLFALVCSFASVLGGMFGYLIGLWGLDLVMPLLESLHWVDKLEIVQGKFNEYGVMYVFLAGFSPIPYKLFTIAAGMSGLGIAGFVMASLVGRSARFFLVAFLIQRGGEQMADKLRHYVEWLGWAVVGIVIIVLLILKLNP